MPRPIGTLGYTCCLCVATALLGTLESGVVKLNLVTLEHRFRLATSALALVLAAYDVAFILALIPFTYLAGGPRSDKPKQIAFGVLLIGLGAITLSLPEFLYPQTSPHLSNDSDLCLSHSPHDALRAEPQSLSQLEIVGVLIVGQILIGIGAMPLYTFAVTWIDENIPKRKSAMYVGFFYTASILGPALGYVLGGYILDHVHTEFLTRASSVLIHPSDSRWIGAWWTLFLGIGIVCLVHGTFMLLYPKNLVRSGPDELYNTREAGGERGPVLKVMKDLGRNSIFVSLCSVSICEAYILSSFSSFMGKYVQNQFGLSTKGSSVIMGCLIVPAGFLGIITGGYLIKRRQMSTFRLLLLIESCLVLSLLFCAGFILVNEPVKFAGINTPYNPDKNILDELYQDPLYHPQKSSPDQRHHDPFYNPDRNRHNKLDALFYRRDKNSPHKHDSTEEEILYLPDEYSYQLNRGLDQSFKYTDRGHSAHQQLNALYSSQLVEDPTYQTNERFHQDRENSPDQLDPPSHQLFKDRPDQLKQDSDYKPPQLTLVSDCNKHCGCSAVQYNPICGVDLVTYYNPCFAGCRSQAVDKYGIKIYYDCSCISKAFNHSHKDIIKEDRNSFNMYRKLFVTSFLKNLEVKEKAKANSADQRIESTFVEEAIEKKIDEMIEDIVGENSKEEHLVNFEEVKYDRDNRRNVGNFHEKMKNSNLENTPTMELSKLTTSQMTAEFPTISQLFQNNQSFQQNQTDLFSSVFSLPTEPPMSPAVCKMSSTDPTSKVTSTTEVNKASLNIPDIKHTKTHSQSTTFSHPVTSLVTHSSPVQPQTSSVPQMPHISPPTHSHSTIIHSQQTTSVAQNPIASLPTGPTHENLLPSQLTYSHHSQSCTNAPDAQLYNSPIRNSEQTSLLHARAFGKACPNTSTHVVLFSLSTFFAFYFMFVCVMPATEGILRSVPFQDKSLALALQWLLIRALATMPSPSILALFIDKSCLYWRSGEYCILYDNYYFSRYLASYAFFFRHLSIYIVLYMLFKVKIDDLK